MAKHLRFYRNWRRRASRFVAPGVVVVGLVTGLCGCQSETLTTGGSGTPTVPEIGPLAQSSARNTEEFQIVDCLLPARIRRLGRNLTYLGARRPIRTTGRDCAIRGGEYVAYDRANYATALKIWLPLAQQGDPAAQTYVGDIYERGLVGEESDYTLAAEWYQRAVKQGYATAQISLGQLHERGLGVPKDMEMALNLYRQASGLEDAFEIVPAAAVRGLPSGADQNAPGPTIPRDPAENELRAAQEQLETLRKEADAQRRLLRAAHQSEIESLHSVLREREASLARRAEEIERQAANLPVRKTELEATRRQAATTLEAMEEARQEYLRRQQELQIEQQQLATERERLSKQVATAYQTAEERAELERLRASLREREARLERLAEELAHRDADITVRDTEVARIRQEAEWERQSLESARQEYTRRQELLDHEQQQMTAEREALREQTAKARKAAEREAELQDLRAAIQKREAALAERAGELGSRATQMSVGEAELARARKEMEAEREQIRVESERLAAKEEKQAEEVKSLRAAAQERDSALAQAKEDVDRYQNELKRQEAAIAEVELQIDSRKAQQSIAALSGIDLGKYYALVIGNEKYKSYRSERDLKSAQADAVAVSGLLSQRYDYEVTTLLDASRDQILGALNTLKGTLRDHDNLLIYYAGHGELDEENKLGYWLPVDAEPRPQTAEWISTTDITVILNAMRAKHVIVVADSCYAGSLTGGSYPLRPMGLMTEEDRQAWLQTAVYRRVRTVLTSGDLSPVLDGGGGRHSIFAMALLQKLGTNSDVLEGARLWLHISSRVSVAAQTRGVTQKPTYRALKERDEGGDYLFVPNWAAAG